MPTPAVAAAATAVTCELALLDCWTAAVQACRRRASRDGDGSDGLLAMVLPLLLLAPTSGRFKWS